MTPEVQGTQKAAVLAESALEEATQLRSNFAPAHPRTTLIARGRAMDAALGLGLSVGIGLTVSAGLGLNRR